jgi:hypothetical protein
MVAIPELQKRLLFSLIQPRSQLNPGQQILGEHIASFQQRVIFLAK